MKRSLRTLENLQLSLSSAGGDAAGGNARSLLEERRLKDAAREHQLAKLSPYKRAEYLCLECVAELRDALRTMEELEYTLTGVAGAPAGQLVSTSREDREAASDDEAAQDERAQLLGGGSGRQRRPARRSGEAAVLQQELLRARQQARRAHQRLQQLQREAARLSTSTGGSTTAGVPRQPAEVAPSSSADATTSAATFQVLEWQRAERHIELAKQWYRELFGILVVSSQPGSSAAAAVAGGASATSSTTLQLNRPAQPQQSAGSMSHFGSGANPLPPGVASASGVASQDGSGEQGHTGGAGDVSAWTGASAYPPYENTQGSSAGAANGGEDDRDMPSSQARMLRSAREDAEFQEFFASVQANDELMDAALDRLSEGLARLLDNARGMQTELAVQEDLLHGTETRLNENEVAIANMNRRLRRAIRDLNDSSVCVYVICLLALLLILAVLLRIAG